MHVCGVAYLSNQVSKPPKRWIRNLDFCMLGNTRNDVNFNQGSNLWIYFWSATRGRILCELPQGADQNGWTNIGYMEDI